MQIHIKTVTGKCKTVEVQSSETIEYIKITMQEGEEQSEGRFRIYANPNLGGMKYPMIPLEVESSDTIKKVKGQIGCIKGILRAQGMILVFNGKLLEDSRTLADYNVHKDSVLDLGHRFL